MNTTERTPVPALEELQTRPQWVCWRKEERGGKDTKVPYTPTTGKRAESNHPTTWGSYQSALQALRRPGHRYDGLGYVFHRDITGVDLDHCVRPDGRIDSWAQAIIDRLNSYTEYSPNDGIHILVRGTIPSGVRRTMPDAPHPQAATEMYCEGRYFTVTGKHVEGTPTTIEACEQELNTLYAHLMTPKQGPLSASVKQGEQPPELWETDLLKRAQEAQNGERFRALWGGERGGYLSESEADLALCLMLAFWTGRDQSRMDRLFRQSGLYRDKWDEQRGQTTYGAMTLAKAVSLCTTVYTPDASRKRLDQQFALLIQAMEPFKEKDSAQDELAGKRAQIVPHEVDTPRVLEYLTMNELGDALLFATCFAGQVCYDVSEKRWYLWTEHFWERCVPGKIYHIVAGYLGMIYLRTKANLNVQYAELASQIQTLQEKGSKEAEVELSDLQEKYARIGTCMSDLETRARVLRTAKRTRNVLAYVEGDERIYVDSSIWDADPWLLACPNGVVDLRTGVCRAGRPEDYIRTVCPTVWRNLDAPCPRFEQFLVEIFEDKHEREMLIAFLQRLFGYGLTGLSTEHVFPILYGEEGRNGKDTLLSVLSDVLGPLVGAISNDVIIAADKVRTGGAATPHLCDLQGKRLVWGSETKQGDRFNISQIKLLTGGGAISARPLYGEQYSFRPTHKLLLMTNYKPHADARDKAFWERVCLIEFGLRFIDRPVAAHERKRDATLGAKLKAEVAGILAWLVRGCLAWQKQGLNLPSSVQLATSKYREEEDQLLDFLGECCVIAPHARVKAASLYEAYKMWCKDNQLHAMNGKLFGDEMSKKFAKKHTENGRVYQGIGVKTPDVGPHAPDPEGSPTSSPRPVSRAEKAPEAARKDMREEAAEGSEGFFQEPPLRGEGKRSFEGGSGKNPSDPSATKVTSPTEVPPEAEGEPLKGQAVPFSLPSVGQETHTCLTVWERYKKRRHLTVATRFVAGCWWCDRCVPQSTLLEIGQRLDFPELNLVHWKVPSGRRQWLRFVQEAGYAMVQQALEVAEPKEGSA